MVETLLIMLYTLAIFGVFLWLIQNDRRPGLSDQTGPFRISGTDAPAGSPAGRAAAGARGRHAAKAARPAGPAATAEAGEAGAADKAGRRRAGGAAPPRRSGGARRRNGHPH